MNGRGGCCIARHAGGGGGMYGMSKVERIMQKYRPIAPKPVAAGSGSGGSTTENSDGYVKCSRGKRKYVRVNVNKKKNGSDKKKKVATTSSSPPTPSNGRDRVVTLSLLPETPDPKENSPVTGFADLLSSAQMKNCGCNNHKRSAPAPTSVWLSFDNKKQKVCYGGVGGFDPVVVKPPPPPPPPPRRLQVVAYVTVECVTDTTWVVGAGIECSDKERVMNMELDTCPGFISDRQDRVVWTNKAFRQMAGAGQVIGGDGISVVLVRKDNWTPSPVTYASFTCKVRINSATYSHSATASPASPTQTLPCDAWRMNCGGCAWRLDVKAALSLGR